MVNSFPMVVIANKRAEIADYTNNVSGEFEKQVSDFEVKTYLPVL